MKSILPRAHKYTLSLLCFVSLTSIGLADSPSLLDQFASDLYIRQVRTASPEALVQLARADQDTERCTKFTQAWPKLTENLNKLPRRSPLLEAAWWKSLVLISQICKYKPADLHRRLTEVQYPANSTSPAYPAFYSPRMLSYMLPVGNLLPSEQETSKEANEPPPPPSNTTNQPPPPKGPQFEWRIEPTKLIDWLWADSLTSLASPHCNHLVRDEFPSKTPECFTPWIFLALDIEATANSSAHNKEQLARLMQALHKQVAQQGIKSWTRLHAFITEKSPEGSAALLDSILWGTDKSTDEDHTTQSLQAQSIQSRAKLIVQNASVLGSLIKNVHASGKSSPQDQSQASCQRARKILEAMPAAALASVEQQIPVDPAAGSFAGGLLMLYCQDPTIIREATASFWAAWPDNIQFSGVLTQVDNPSLLDISVHSLEQDLRDRNLLGLRFNYGLEFDLADLSTLQSSSDQTSAYTAVIDFMIAAHLRGSDASPWVRLVENIEDQEFRQQLNREALRALAQVQQPGYRLFQISYLGFFDRAEQGQNANSSQDLIDAIRVHASRVAANLPSFQDFVFEAHNNLHQGLLDNLAELVANLSPAERQANEAEILALQTAMERFFLISIDPTDIIQQSLARLQKLLEPVDAQNLATELGDMLTSLQQKAQARLVVEATLKTQALLSQQLLKNEQQKNRSRQIRQQGPSPQQLDDIYIELLRTLRALNGILLAKLPQLQSQDMQHLWPWYSSYIRSLLGPAAGGPGPLSPDSIAGLVAKSVQDTTRPRSLRFDWFLANQQHRAIHNSDYPMSVAYRRYALQGLSERLLRDLGLQNISRWEQNTQASTYRAMNPGSAIGKLTFVDKSALATHAYRRDEILITNALPLNLGVTSGLITEVFQPLASHVDLRTKERGTPNAFVADARKQWDSLLGKWVRLEVNTERTSLTEIDPEQIPKATRRKAIQIPAIDASVGAAPLSLDADASQTSTNRVGAKAFGFAHLRRLFGPNANVPPALAIPFPAYQWVLEHFKLSDTIDNWLHELDDDSPPEKVQANLAKIRDLIQSTVDSKEFRATDWYQQLIQQISTLQAKTITEGMQEAWGRPADGCFRFRSSTNAEDLNGFTGAGLYDSKTGCLSGTDGQEKKSISKALAKVWASLWAERAYAERQHYGIAHRDVSMAILVHRNFPDEGANGVMLTRSRLDPSYFASVQSGEESVTNSTGGQAGDEYSARLVGDQLIVDQQTLKDKQTPVLSSAELLELLQAGNKIASYFRRPYSRVANAPNMRMDLEFKFLPENATQTTTKNTAKNTTENTGQKRRLIIKQARPFLSD